MVSPVNKRIPLLKIMQNKKVIHVYGEKGAGKTTFALQLAKEVALSQREKKIIYTNVNGKFDPRRLKQIAGDFFTLISKKIIVFNINTFDEQSELIDYIPLIGKSIGLVILDDFTYLLWNKIAIENEESLPYLLEFNRQLAFMKYFSNKFGYQVILTNLINVENKEPLYHSVISFWSDLDINILKYKKYKDVIGQNRNLRVVNIYPSNIKLFLKLSKDGLILENPRGLEE